MEDDEDVRIKEIRGKNSCSFPLMVMMMLLLLLLLAREEEEEKEEKKKEKGKGRRPGRADERKQKMRFVVICSHLKSILSFS